MIDILEERDDWYEKYKSIWLAHYHETGETKWDIYPRPDNKTAPAGKAVDLSKSRLLLITSAGGFLKASQKRFDDENDLGDYTLRTFPTSTALSELAFAHTHYDHQAVDEDPQVLVPLRHLEDMVREGIIGELTENVITFCGYMPDMGRVIDELIPAILEIANAERSHAALLVPA